MTVKSDTSRSDIYREVWAVFIKRHELSPLALIRRMKGLERRALATVSEASHEGVDIRRLVARHLSLALCQMECSYPTARRYFQIARDLGFEILMFEVTLSLEWAEYCRAHGRAAEGIDVLETLCAKIRSSPDRNCRGVLDQVRVLETSLTHLKASAK